MTRWTLKWKYYVFQLSLQNCYSRGKDARPMWSSNDHRTSVSNDYYDVAIVLKLDNERSLNGQLHLPMSRNINK